MVDKTLELEPNETLKQKKKLFIKLVILCIKFSPHHQLELINTCSNLKLHIWPEAWLIFLTSLHQTFDPAALC